MTSSPQNINNLTENEFDCVCLQDLDLKPIIYCSDVVDDDSLINNLMNISIQNDSTSNVNRNPDLSVLSGMIYIYDSINLYRN